MQRFLIHLWISDGYGNQTDEKQIKIRCKIRAQNHSPQSGHKIAAAFCSEPPPRGIRFAAPVIHRDTDDGAPAGLLACNRSAATDIPSAFPACGQWLFREAYYLQLRDSTGLAPVSLFTGRAIGPTLESIVIFLLYYHKPPAFVKRIIRHYRNSCITAFDRAIFRFCGLP